MAHVVLTDRALDDLRAIEAYSQQTWGKKQAAKYLAVIEGALDRLAEMPGLLRSEDIVAGHLHFFLAGRHYLVCDREKDTVLVLTVLHGSRDLVARIDDLAPTLAHEVALLRRKF